MHNQILQEDRRKHQGRNAIPSEGPAYRSALMFDWATESKMSLLVQPVGYVPLCNSLHLSGPEGFSSANGRSEPAPLQRILVRNNSENVYQPSFCVSTPKNQETLSTYTTVVIIAVV